MQAAPDLVRRVAELEALLAEREAALRGAERLIEQLRLQLAQLRRQQFGRSSEKLEASIQQLELRLEDLEEAQGATAARTAAPAPRTSGRRAAARPPLPQHLPREDVLHHPGSVCPGCSGTHLSALGEDVTEVLETIPARLKVVRHVRPKFSCRACETILQAPAPDLPIRKGRSGAGLIAQVVVDKYLDGLPLYRQSARLARGGLEIGRDVLADWVGHAAWWLAPLAERIAAHVMAAPVLHTDDTPIALLAPGLGKTRTARLWTYVLDERPWCGPRPPAALYRFSPDRKQVRPHGHLQGFIGAIQADAYSGYEALVRSQAPPRILLVACWAHARRKFFEIHETTGSPIAEEALRRIQMLYAIEAQITGSSPEARRAIRQAEAVPLLASFKAWLEDQRRRLSAKSALAKAIGYALARWSALTCYAGDGRYAIDNNPAERALRGIAVTRKNYLFLGSQTGGERAATLYTIIETARMNGLDPQGYIAAVIDRMACGHPITRIDELLPWNWCQEHNQPGTAA